MNLQSLREDDDYYGGGETERGLNFVSDADDSKSYTEDEEEDTLSDDDFNDDLHRQEINSPQQAAFDAKIFEQYHTMIDLTLELVRDITIVKKGDEVLTAYGKGVLLTRNGKNGSMEIQLPFGGKLYHRQPEMVHKVISPDQYEQAIEHLEEVRKLGLAAQSQQWNVSIIDEVCVACLFDKPYCKTLLVAC